MKVLPEAVAAIRVPRPLRAGGARDLGAGSPSHLHAARRGQQDGGEYLVWSTWRERVAARLERGRLSFEQALRSRWRSRTRSRRPIARASPRDLKPGNIMLARAPARSCSTSASPRCAEQPFAGALGRRRGDAAHIRGRARRDPPVHGAGTARRAGGRRAHGPVRLRGRSSTRSSPARSRSPARARRASSLRSCTPAAAAVARSSRSHGAALDHLVKTSLAKDPDDRWQTARDLLRELRRVEQGDADCGGARKPARCVAGSSWIDHGSSGAHRAVGAGMGTAAVRGATSGNAPRNLHAPGE